MDIEDVSEFIGTLRKRKGFTIESLAKAISISPQGLHNWIYKRKNINWKLQYLIELSKILKFELNIKNGILSIKENCNMEENFNFTNNLERTSSESIRTNELEIYKNFGNMAICKAYTINSNISDDETPELLEDWLYFYNKEDCYFEYNEPNPVPMYVLIEYKEDGTFEDKKASLCPYTLETLYYIRFADTIGTTSDGYKIVGVDNHNKIKIVKTYAKMKVLSNSAFIQGYSIINGDKTLLGLAVMPLYGTSYEDFVNWYENIKYFYDEQNLMFS